jgi:hypothetical protein
MSTPTTPMPPAGSDGVVPIYEPQRRWTQWNVAELYQGPNTPGTQHYVPNVNDMALDLTTYNWYQITAVDPTTFVPTLKEITQTIPDDTFSDLDRLLSPGPGPRPNTYMLYINQGVKPFVAAIDARLYVMGTQVTSCQVGVGSQLDGTWQVISALYDQSGNLLGQSIPLEVVDGMGAVKSVPPFATTVALTDGEIVTVIFYSATGSVVSICELMVQNTAFIRSPEQGVKYVTGISVSSPFLSSADPTLIQYPLNVPLNGLNLMGTVNYSDGSSRTLPVDGTKFRMMGLNAGFVATVVGQEIPLVLRYNLSPGEIAYGVTANAQYFIAKEYTAKTIDTDGAYTVKLFAYPVWVDAATGYRLEWFMFNLDRSTWYDVTPYITYQTPFNPLAYGVQQNLQVQINLSQVNGTFKNFIFTQTIGIALLAQGTEQQTNWQITFAPGQSPPFGPNNYASTTFVNQNYWVVNLAMGETDLSDWLARVYWATLPLYDPLTEVQAPTPNMFSLEISGTEYEFPISQWNQDLVSNVAIPNASTLFVRFFNRSGANDADDLQLAIAGFPVYQSDVGPTPTPTPTPSPTPAPSGAPVPQIAMRPGWFTDLTGSESLYYPAFIGEVQWNAPPQGPNAVVNWVPMIEGIQVQAANLLMNIAVIQEGTQWLYDQQPVSWSVEQNSLVTLYAANAFPYESVYADAEEIVQVKPNTLTVGASVTITGTFADGSTISAVLTMAPTPQSPTPPPPSPTPPAPTPVYAYHFLNAGANVIESFGVGSNGQPSVPRWGVSQAGMASLVAYPGGVGNLGYTPAYTLEGGNVSIPEYQAADQDTLWSLFANPFAQGTDVFSNVVPITNGTTSGTVTASGEVGTMFDNVTDYINWLIAIQAAGSGTSDSVWADMTTQLTAAGVYSGSNQVIAMPLWKELTVTYSNTFTNPPVSNQRTTEFVFTDTFTYVNNGQTVTETVVITAPTVLIERVQTN